jgi:HEAT repeat protein
MVLEHDSNPNVRSEAIDVLVPANGQFDLSPSLAGMLETILRSERENEYVRLRCMQALHDRSGTGGVY